MIKGSKHSKETRRKMSMAKIGKPGNTKGMKLSQERKDHLSCLAKGRKHSKKTILKLRKIVLKRYKDKPEMIEMFRQKSIQMYKDRPELRNTIMKERCGENHHNWKGGKSKKANGYILILKPDHPFANSNRYIMEHRLVMENAIGRFLRPEEVVHHINGKIEDNRIENLELVPSKSAHRKIHAGNH